MEKIFFTKNISYILLFSNVLTLSYLKSLRFIPDWAVACSVIATFIALIIIKYFKILFHFYMLFGLLFLAVNIIQLLKKMKK
jgi:type III secretory pathway component EscU